MAPLFGFLITVGLPTVRAIRGSGVASAQGGSMAAFALGFFRVVPDRG